MPCGAQTHEAQLVRKILWRISLRLLFHNPNCPYRGGISKLLENYYVSLIRGVVQRPNSVSFLHIESREIRGTAHGGAARRDILPGPGSALGNQVAGRPEERLDTQGV